MWLVYYDNGAEGGVGRASVYTKITSEQFRAMTSGTMGLLEFQDENDKGRKILIPFHRIFWIEPA